MTTHNQTTQNSPASAARWFALGAALLTGSAALAQTPMPGQTLAFDRSKGNCLTCHAIAGGDAPGNVGPPLSDMKARYPDRKELTAIIFDETKRNPQTVMPPFGRNLILTDAEIESVIDFLYTK
jgi:sulfur-oxidizing protein SoxX